MAFIPQEESDLRRRILLQNEQLNQGMNAIQGGLNKYADYSANKETEARKAALLEQERIDKANAAEGEANAKFNLGMREQEFKAQQAQLDREAKAAQAEAERRGKLDTAKIASEDRRYMADAVGARNKENNATKVAINQNKPEKAPAQPSASEFQAATFYDRMNQAEKAFSNPNYTEASTSRGQQALGFLPGELQSEDYILGKQAERNFANAVLRKESGAAIGKEEFASAEKQYFPRPGDTEAVIAQKARNRQAVIQGLGREASRVVTQNAGNINQANPIQSKPIGNLTLEEKKAQIRAMRAKGM